MDKHSNPTKWAAVYNLNKALTVCAGRSDSQFYTYIKTVQLILPFIQKLGPSVILSMEEWIDNGGYPIGAMQLYSEMDIAKMQIHGMCLPPFPLPGSSLRIHHLTVTAIEHFSLSLCQHLPRAEYPDPCLLCPREQHESDPVSDRRGQQ